MTHARVKFHLLLALLSVAAAWAAAEEAAVLTAPREPAPVMGVGGAPWLERPGRVEEEQPQKTIAAMDLQPGDVVADIGAGTGFYTRRLAEAVGPEGKVYAVDIQPEMLDLLERYAEDAGVENIEPVLGETADPKLPPESVDWVLLVDTYHEFQEPAAMLARILDALKPDGKVALVEYRLHGPTAQHIKRDHRMSPTHVLSEWEAEGFELIARHEFLPTQHLFIFGKEKPEADAPASPQSPEPRIH